MTNLQYVLEDTLRRSVERVKVFKGEKISFDQAIALCHSGYKIAAFNDYESKVYVKAATIDGRYDFWIFRPMSQEPTPFVTGYEHYEIDWMVIE